MDSMDRAEVKKTITSMIECASWSSDCESCDYHREHGCSEKLMRHAAELMDGMAKYMDANNLWTNT